MDADAPNLRSLLDRHGPDLGSPPLRLAVVGPGGFGKSHLLRRLTEHLAARDVRVIRLAGRRLDRDVPFGVLGGLLARARAGVLAGGTHAGPRIRDAILARLKGRHVVLVVDDAHHLDPGSLAVLAGLAEHPGAAETGIVAAHRPMTGPPALAALDSALGRDGTTIVLEPMSEREITELAAARLGLPPSAGLVDALAAYGRGSAAITDALLSGWMEAGSITRTGIARPLRLPPAVRALVAAELHQLDESCRRVLIALAAGAPGGGEALASVAGVRPTGVEPALESLLAAGLAGAEGEVAPAVGAALAALVPAAVRARVHRSLATDAARRGAPVTEVAEHLASAGVADPEAAATFLAAGDAVLAEAPDLALAWYERAAAAGGDPDGIAVRRGEATALSGDAEGALRLVERAVADEGARDHERALVVAAATLGTHALWDQSADSCRRLAVLTTGAESARFQLQAVPALVAAGQTEAARTLEREGARALGSPTSLLAQSSLLIARGALGATGAEVGGALDQLLRAAASLDLARELRLLPETPHALAAVVAVCCLTPDPARVVLERALEHQAGGPLLAARHRLLLAWTELLAGRWERAAVELGQTRAGGIRLSPRDELAAAALDAALGRRTADMGRMTMAVDRAYPFVLRHPPDLFSLPLLGELVSAEARLRSTRLTGWWEEAGKLVRSAGDPPLFSAWHAWTGVQRAVAAERPEEAAVAADAIGAIPPAAPRLSAMSAAARAWAGVLGGRVAGDEIRAAAAGLGNAGLVWEASRLVGAAAIRARSRSTAKSLLNHARELRARLPSVTGAPRDEAPVRAVTLSDREREVGAAVLSGMTHKEIGAHLFISPKTVEHHVASIRQKVGAGSRAELLSRLRDALAGA